MPRHTTQIQPRKRPTQERSRATVDAIVGGAARVLVRYGYASATTNRIAEAAGVSVGSIYQYFESKEAVVLALANRHLDEILALAPVRLEAAHTLPLPDAVRQLVELLLEAHAVDPKLHEVLTQQVPRALMKESVTRIDRLFAKTISNFLDAHRNEIARTNLPLAAFVVGQALEALTHSAVVHHPSQLRGGALASEMTDLIVSYLQNGARPQRRPRP